MEIEVTKECYCEHYLHEMIKYPRVGLVEKKFLPGEKFEVAEKWNNLYGVFYRVEVDGKNHDIDVNNCKIISE